MIEVKRGMTLAACWKSITHLKTLLMSRGHWWLLVM